MNWLSTYIKTYFRIVTSATKNFRAQHIPMFSSALTFTTLLAFVPFFAILFLSAHKLGYLSLLSEVLPKINNQLVLGIPDDNIKQFIHQLRIVKFEKVGYLGIFFIFISFLISIGHIEKSMNVIWNVKKSRNWWTRIWAYSPFLIILVLYILVISWILVKLRNVIQFSFLAPIGGAIPKSVGMGGSIITILALTWLFLFMLFYIIPYTKVSVKSSIIGTTFTLAVLIFYYILVTKIHKLIFINYSIIYGAFAFIPITLLALYINWFIVLFGVSLTHSHQVVTQKLHQHTGKSGKNV